MMKFYYKMNKLFFDKLTLISIILLFLKIVDLCPIPWTILLLPLVIQFVFMIIFVIKFVRIAEKNYNNFEGLTQEETLEKRKEISNKILGIGEENE